MKKMLINFSLLIILPVYAYQVYMPDEYSYEKQGNKLLFVVDFSNSMGEYLEHKTKVHLVKEMMKKVFRVGDAFFKVVGGQELAPVTYWGASEWGDSIAFSFPKGNENRGFAASSRSERRSSAPHFECSNLPKTKKEDTRMGVFFFWWT